MGFGDLILPISLVVMVGACALCSVVIVIIRQLCVKRQRSSNARRNSKKQQPPNYIHALPLSMQPPNVHSNRFIDRPPLALSDTDSIKQQRIHRVDPLYSSNAQSKSRSAPNRSCALDGKPLTIPLKKTTFCRTVQLMNSTNDVMMDDIVSDMDHKYALTNVNDDEFSLDIGDSMSDDANSDDTMMEKPHHHNYSTLTLRSGLDKLQIIDDASIQTMTTADNDSMITNGQQQYHEITRSNFNRLQAAINNAKTNSDFAKLEKIIKSGKMPRDNWHGKGKAYEQQTVQQESESSMDSKSESSDGMQQQQQLLLTVMEEETKPMSMKKANKSIPKLSNKSVPLDGDELSNKLKRLRNDRMIIREKQSRKLEQRKNKKYSQYSKYARPYNTYLD